MSRAFSHISAPPPPPTHARTHARTHSRTHARTTHPPLTHTHHHHHHQPPPTHTQSQPNPNPNQSHPHPHPTTHLVLGEDVVVEQALAAGDGVGLPAPLPRNHSSTCVAGHGTALIAQAGGAVAASRGGGRPRRVALAALPAPLARWPHPIGLPRRPPHTGAVERSVGRPRACAAPPTLLTVMSPSRIHRSHRLHSMPWYLKACGGPAREGEGAARWATDRWTNHGLVSKRLGGSIASCLQCRTCTSGLCS